MSLIDAPPLLLPAPKAIIATGEWRTVPERFGVHGHPDYKQVVRTVLGDRAGEDQDAVETQIVLGVAIEPLKNPEAYRLIVQPSRILIEADDARGAAHGARTLMQLLRQYTDRIPCVRVQDRPAFPVRGVMLDISRDRVPTMEHLLSIVDRLASWKINHLQLYVEHTFAYRGHEEVWRPWSAITPAEIRVVQARCQAHGIELAANQNCFGHLERWFSHPRYAGLAEIQGAQTPWSFLQWTKHGPFSLCPTDPAALELIADLLTQLSACFSSSLVNIGCDETWDVGQGRSRAEVERRGRSAVYLDFVAQVCALLKPLSKRPMMWADIVLHDPGLLALLPENLIGLAWDYEPDARFRQWCDQLRAAKRQAWVCPGTSSWRSITGRTTERRGNLLSAARDGISGGATGFLVTNWGDEGHRQQWPIELHALAEAAHRAWSGEAPFDTRASSLHAFDDVSLRLGEWLDELGDADRPLRAIAGTPTSAGAATQLRNASALFVDLHQPVDQPWIGTVGEWQAVEDRLASMFDNAPLGLDALITAETMHSLEEASKTARRAILRRRSPHDRSWRASVAASFHRLEERHRELWLARSRPGGLEDSSAYYGRIIADLER
jgi:hexosaminidase